MTRCLYGVIISLLLFNSLATTAILALFVVFTRQLLDKLNTFPPVIDAKINEIMRTFNVDDKINMVAFDFNRTLFTAIDGTVESIMEELNETGTLVETSIHSIQEDLAYLRNRSIKFNAFDDAPT